MQLSKWLCVQDKKNETRLFLAVGESARSGKSQVSFPQQIAICSGLTNSNDELEKAFQNISPADKERELNNLCIYVFLTPLFSKYLKKNAQLKKTTILSGLIAFIAGWYGISRIRSKHKPLTLYWFSQNSTEDDRMDYGEQRWVTLGLLGDRVVHTETEEEIGIISMRKANKNEQLLFFRNL